MHPRVFTIACAISVGLFAIPLFAAEALEFDCHGLVSASHNGNPSNTTENFHLTVNWDVAKPSIVISGDTQIVQAIPEVTALSINMEIAKTAFEVDKKGVFNYRESAKGQLLTQITLDPKTGKFTYWKSKRENSSIQAEGRCRPIQFP